MRHSLIIICFAVAFNGLADRLPAQTRNADEQQLMQLERDLAKANVTKDVSLAQRVLADDYTGATSRGTTYTKAQAIAGIQRDSFTSYDVDNLKVRIYGDA